MMKKNTQCTKYEMWTERKWNKQNLCEMECYVDARKRRRTKAVWIGWTGQNETQRSNKWKKRCAVHHVREIIIINTCNYIILADVKHQLRAGANQTENNIVMLRIWTAFVLYSFSHSIFTLNGFFFFVLLRSRITIQFSSSPNRAPFHYNIWKWSIYFIIERKNGCV